MAETNRCLACGREYEICGLCPAAVTFTPWRRIYCSADCFRMFETARSYKNGEKTKQEARRSLARIKTDGYQDFHTNTGKIITEIMTDGGNEL